MIRNWRKTLQNILHGIGSILEIYPSPLSPPCFGSHGTKSDKEAFQSDWQSVIIENENGQE